MMLHPADADALYRTAGLVRDPNEGTLLVGVLDCAARVTPGATVQVAGARRVVYLASDSQLDLAATETSTDSAALVLGVPAGAVDIDISVDDVSYRGWPLTSRANALVTSWRRP